MRRGRLLNRLTIGWNALEGVVAVAAGLAAGSVSLVGFGLDSGIEVSAAAGPGQAQGRPGVGFAGGGIGGQPDLAVRMAVGGAAGGAGRHLLRLADPAE